MTIETWIAECEKYIKPGVGLGFKESKQALAALKRMESFIAAVENNATASLRASAVLSDVEAILEGKVTG